jgi:hypothetical protein
MKRHHLVMGCAALLLALVSGRTVVAGTEPPASAAEKLSRIPDTRYELHGVVQEYIAAITEHWLLNMPDRNPALLQMFADRDKRPHRNLLPWSGEFAGKYLTGATQVLRLTHDPKLKAYLAKFVADLVALQAEDGYLGPFPRENRLDGKGSGDVWKNYGTWDVWGHYHIMLGLLLWHEDTGDPQALQCAVKIGDLLCRKFLHTSNRVVDAGKWVEMNHAALHALCLLYKVTKTPAYLELARQIADEEFPDPRAGDFVRAALAGKEFYQVAKPRWESLHSLQGVAELYWLTGQESYRIAFEQLWWSMVKLERHNNGGFSSGEQAQGNPYHQGAIETCCTVAWIALGVDMLRLTGSSIVADELELSTLNQVLGYQHRSGAWCTYNTPMDGVRRNGTKAEVAFQIRPGSEEVNCCSANAPRGFGLISAWALMTDGQGLVLNWYGPSTLSTKLKGTAVAITQQTDYPHDGRIMLTIAPEHTLRFPLQLRIPYWSARSRVQVNGQSIPDVKPGAYLVLDRDWKPGDSVQVDLDLSLHYWVGERECLGKTSIYRGPLLLVYELDGQGPTPGPAIHFSDGWKQLAQSAVTKQVGASLETPFEGTAVTWKGCKFDDAGHARVTIDGKDIAVVDQYGPKRGDPFKWEYHDLPPGKHLLKLTVLDEKDPDSKDRWINVAGIDPVPYAGPVLDATALAGSLVPTADAKAPLLMMEFTDTAGKKVRLHDYGTAGEGGVHYLSWLKVLHVEPAPFSEANPLRSSRATQ